VWPAATVSSRVAALKATSGLGLLSGGEVEAGGDRVPAARLRSWSRRPPPAVLPPSVGWRESR
jgi:hypothetical protein